ncbi:MAG: Fur family transcriptional regulator [Anaerolineales bacterium]|nr:Fur family transcriptional regulator [Anaerolineales bacterium]
MPGKLKSPPCTNEAQQNEMLETLRRAGLRLTPQRYAICRALSNNREHPTAQALFQQLRSAYPSLSQATVYNTLHTLVNAGLLCEVGAAGDNAVHFDPDVSLHVHLICTQCHQIEDMTDSALANVARRVEQSSGYQLNGSRIAFLGLCPRCQPAYGKRGSFLATGVKRIGKRQSKPRRGK